MRAVLPFDVAVFFYTISFRRRPARFGRQLGARRAGCGTRRWNAGL